MPSLRAPNAETGPRLWRILHETSNFAKRLKRAAGIGRIRLREVRDSRMGTVRSADRFVDPSLLEGLYDCVFEPARWRGQLAQICDLSGSEAATLVLHDLTSRTAALPHEACTDHSLAESYCNRYARLNPHIDAIRADGNVGKVTTSQDLLGTDVFKSSRFFEEWCRPSGLGDLAVCVLLRTPTHVGTVGFGRRLGKGAYNADSVERLGQVVPHLARAARLGALVNEERIASRAFAGLVEHLAVAAVVVDRQGRILRTNGAADDLLSAGAVATSRERRLRFKDPRADAAVHRAVASPPDIPAFAAAEDARGSRVLVTVIPPGEATGGHSIVLIGRPQEGLGNVSQVLIDVYGLTPAEYRVLSVLVEGLTPNEVADRLGLAIATVRTHIRRVLEKTGTARQADLMAEIARVLPPIRM